MSDSGSRLKRFAERPVLLGLPGAALLLLGLGLAARLAWALLHPIAPVDDFLEYDQLARSVAFDDYYGIEEIPGAFRPPGFPFVLAGVYYLFGTDEGVAAATVAALLVGNRGPRRADRLPAAVGLRSRCSRRRCSR